MEEVSLLMNRVRGKLATMALPLSLALALSKIIRAGSAALFFCYSAILYGGGGIPRFRRLWAGVLATKGLLPVRNPVSVGGNGSLTDETCCCSPSDDEDKREKQRRYWDARARDYGDENRTGDVGYYRWLEFLFVGLNLCGRNALDCGCGDGLFLWHLKRWFLRKNFVGIDFSAEMIRAGLAKHRDLDLRLMDMTSLQFGGHHFDTTFAVRSLKNLLSRELQRKAIQEICRVTRSAAIIVDSIEDGYRGPIPAFNLYLREADLLEEFDRQGFSLVRKLYFERPERFWKWSSRPLGNEGFFVFHRVAR